MTKARSIHQSSGRKLAVLAAAVLAAAASAAASAPAASAASAPSGPLSAPPTTAQCEQLYRFACYQPDQIRAAYHLPALYKQGITGTGATIAIVDPFGSPTIRNDLATFDRRFGYPAPPSFKVIAPAGQIPAYNASNPAMVNGAGETTLDVEYAHALAPGASILLVETPVDETEGTTGFPQIVAAEKYVVDHGLADVISQTSSATEQTFTSYQQLAPLRAAYLDAYAHGVSVVVDTGDSGVTGPAANGSYYPSPVTQWPSSDPLVTAVGGTRLTLTGGQFTSVAWNDTDNPAVNEFAAGDAGPNPAASGGGKSEFFARPSYQDGVKSVVGTQRGVPDISMSGACNGSADMYQSFAGQPAGWYPTCGTSEATPEFAGIVALASQLAGHPLGQINPALYELSGEQAAGIVDVTTGNNTVEFPQGGKLNTVLGFSARPGYDLASGVGTVWAPLFVPELAFAATALP